MDCPKFIVSNEEEYISIQSVKKADMKSLSLTVETKARKLKAAYSVTMNIFQKKIFSF